MSQKRKKKKNTQWNGKTKRKTWKEAIADLDMLTIAFFAMGFIALCYSFYQVFIDWNTTTFIFNVVVAGIWVGVFARSVKRGGFF
jgi:hypothetical protein